MFFLNQTANAYTLFFMLKTLNFCFKKLPKIISVMFWKKIQCGIKKIYKVKNVKLNKMNARVKQV